ncbi:ABC transporter substrate-binding protein [Candidatus Woesearchaeota archaeon]|nr:ABC transporter substrate-binding protein [Candidatus Woesearchaeota archaeon]
MEANKLIFATGILLVVLFITSCTTPTGEVVKEDDVIKIGAILPLTGRAAVWGGYVRNGIDIAIKEINDPNLEVIYEDSVCDPKQAVSSYNYLVNVKGVKMVIGGLCSPATLAMAPIAEKDKIILFTPASSAASITQAGDYIFRDHTHVKLEIKTVLDAFKDEYKSYAVIYDSGNDALYQASVFMTEFLGEENVIKIPIQGGKSDYRTELLKLKTSIDEFDAISLETFIEDAQIIMKQLKELGISKPIIADKATAGNPKFVELLGLNAEGVIYAEPEFNRDTDPSFWDEYLATYNQEPVFLSAQGYDVLNILYDIAKNMCGQNTECIKNRIYEVKNYPGAAGITSFDENGDAVKKLVLKTIRNGEFVVYEGENNE